MAIVEMSHIRLVGLRRDQNRILDAVSADGLFEARTTDALPFGLQSGNTDLYRKLKLKQSKVTFALGFLKARHAAMESVLADNHRQYDIGSEKRIEYELSAEKYSESRMLITRADFSDAAAREYELLHVCDDLEKLSFELVERKSRISELDGAISAYKPFAAAPIKLSELSRAGEVTIAIYCGRGVNPPVELLDALPCAYELRKGDGIAVITVCRAMHDDEISKRLSALGFVRCSFDDDCTAAQKIEALAAEKADIERHIFELTKKALDYEKFARELRILYDVVGLDIERAEAEQKFLKTDNAFVLEGWLPARTANAVAQKLRDGFSQIYVQLLAPEERDEPPTLVENNRIVSPYEEITNMYSPPKYREIDPNPIMSVFYFIFFGLMVGDAAYGLILAVAGFIIGNSKKFDKGFKRVALLVGMGGVSAVLWGILFGGYFSIDFGNAGVTLWFNPLEEPVMMLVLSIVLGCVQMTVGYIIKFVALCKAGKPFSAVFDAGSIIILFGAVACLGSKMMLDAPPQSLTTAALVLAVIGLALIVVFGGRNSKSVIGKMFGGLKGLYGLVNLLSDVLSYCRLFGLGLASGAIGLAFNTLGGVLFGIPVLGYPIGIIILIPLHAFNIGIGILGAYVHNARLQFLEFYGKFYEGGGRLFEPLGSKTRYVRYS